MAIFSYGFSVARLRPLSRTVSKEEQEVAEVAWLPLEFFLALEPGQTYPTQLAIADILRASGNDTSLTDWPREALPGATRAVAATDQALSFYHRQPPPAASPCCGRERSSRVMKCTETGMRECQMTRGITKFNGISKFV